MQEVNMFTEYFKLCPSRANIKRANISFNMNEQREKQLAKNRGVKHYKLQAGNSGSHADIIMTSNDSTLTKCPS